jgi:site-specific recombinase XerD
MQSDVLDKSMLDYLRHLESTGRKSTAVGYRHSLVRVAQWLLTRKEEPVKATTPILLEYQLYLAREYRKPNGEALKRSTQGTWLAAVKGYYNFLYRRGVVLHDAAAKLNLPKIKSGRVKCDHLSQQEATAIIQTQAAMMAERKEGSQYWALECRNLAVLALAMATGRRRTSIQNLRVKDLDFERNEVRIEWEKGKAGRVLPCAAWAMRAAKDYIEKARPLLIALYPQSEWLFVGQRTERICGEYLGRLLRLVQARTVERNPDLEELAGKKLKTHSLRVTFATMMFFNGAGIRIVNELLMHTNLSTTARYTPLELEDLRRACLLAHPRA